MLWKMGFRQAEGNGGEAAEWSPVAVPLPPPPSSPPPPPALDPTTVSRAHATSRHPVLTVLPS